MRNPTKAWLLTFLLWSPGSLALALDPRDVPAQPPNDAIMATAAETASMADWAAAAFGGGGSRQTPAAAVRRPNEPDAPPLLTPAGPPFSFVLGGKPSGELLKDWKRTAEAKDLPDRIRHRVAWTDPGSGLRVAAEVVVYKRYPAADWVLRFENTARQDTPIIEDIQALDVTLGTSRPEQPGVLHHLAGDDCSERSFLPIESPLPAGGKIRLAPNGGRSSNGTFPFFNFAYGKRGLFTAIGWTGQWAASYQRDAAGPTRLRAGMERTHLRLHPGEAIRSPRILLMAWQGDLLAAHNRFRRLILFHYIPQEQSRPLAMPVFWQCYDRYNGHPTWPSEAGQCHAAQIAAKAGCDFLWLDAAWFPGNFPNGVGNWSCKPKEFPHGLKPVSDACHRLGLRFIVWFEPERVAAGSQIAREHPEFVFGGANSGLFKLSDPAARRWLTDLLVRRIGEFGMDWYRNDFNIDPLPFWRQNDAADRQGMTEIRYVEGHYAMWDEMIARYPGLFIDNCASGGRRIDLESIQRSVALWRSDTACQAGRGDWHQAQACGMSYFLPLHEICAWTPDAYEMRSTAGAGAIVQFAFLDGGFSIEAARQAVAEVKENQKYFYGDFYPLSGCSTDPGRFLAYQVHRADLGAGLVLAFRRAKCNLPAISVALGGIDPQAEYQVEFIDEHRQKTAKTMSGRGLATDLSLTIPQPGASLLVRYRAIGLTR
ncbi:MAG: alpha-galactosidase [Thermoguttaceae bacterium]|jgi:alpha-galactosidase